MNTYFIQCFLDQNRINEIPTLRTTHLLHIDKYKSQIKFGGIVCSPEQEYHSICFFISAENEKNAWNFINNDPYSILFTRVDVLDFKQRIP